MNATLHAVILEAPILGALIGAVVVVLAGMWGIVHLEIRRMVKISRLETEIELRRHRDSCPGSQPVVQVVPQSESARFALDR